MKMITPEQIRAARALLRLEQRELAARAHVSVATLRRAESEHGMSAVAPSTFAQVRAALEEAGVEFIYGGVRHLKKRSPEEIEERRRAIRDAADRFAAIPAANPNFGEDDLYDESGLPT